jgi:hypothetical protein
MIDKKMGNKTEGEHLSRNSQDRIKIAPFNVILGGVNVATIKI